MAALAVVFLLCWAGFSVLLGGANHLFQKVVNSGSESSSSQVRPWETSELMLVVTGQGEKTLRDGWTIRDREEWFERLIDLKAVEETRKRRAPKHEDVSQLLKDLGCPKD